MSLRQINRSVCFSALLLASCVGFAQAQSMTNSPQPANGPITYKTYDQTFFREEPVKGWRWVEQEVMETSEKSRWVQEYDTEKLERKSVSYRPIEKTSERVEKYKEMEPVTVTKYREKEYEETSYETAVEMREEKVLVKKPIVETVMRDKEFNVREKVTEQSFEYKPTTTLKPIQMPETTLVPTNVIVPGVVNTRPRLKWLRPGTYVDPVTGLAEYRRRGLHWTSPTPVAAVVQGLTPQTSNRTAYIPETTVKKEPIEISRFVDRVEVRKVPVEVESIRETYETRKVPVEVRRPKTTYRVEKIPYQETTYREVEKVRKVPVVEKTMQKVETIEPYERTTAKWVEKVEEVKTPKIVRKKVEYTSTKKVPYTVRMRVAVDCYGNAVGEPEPVDPRWKSFMATTKRPSDADLERTERENRNRSPSSFNVDRSESVRERPTSVPADLAPTLRETSEFTSSRPSVERTETYSVLVPETETRIETTTTMDKLAGAPLEVKTPLRALSSPRSPAESVGGDSSNVVVRTVPAAGRVLPAIPATEETSAFKPTVETTTRTTFDRDLIEPPSVPNIAPRTFDVRGIDQVQELERRSIENIY